MDTDKALVDKIVQGNRHAFRELIERFERLVCHVVFRLVTNETDREEICQEVFVKVYRNLGQFNFQSKLSTWIARIAYHTSINYLQKKKIPLFEDVAERENDQRESGLAKNEGISIVADREPISDEQLRRSEMTGFLRKEIERLPALYRAVVTLYYLEEMSINEISEIMDLPIGTLKSYLFRARKQLKDNLLVIYPQEELW